MWGTPKLAISYSSVKGVDGQDSEGVPGRVMLGWILKDEYKSVRGRSNSREGGSQQREGQHCEAWKCGEHSASGICGLVWLGLMGDKTEQVGSVHSGKRWLCLSVARKSGCESISEGVLIHIHTGKTTQSTRLVADKSIASDWRLTLHRGDAEMPVTDWVCELSDSEEICWVEVFGIWLWHKQLCSELYLPREQGPVSEGGSQLGVDAVGSQGRNSTAWARALHRKQTNPRGHECGRKSAVKGQGDVWKQAGRSEGECLCQSQRRCRGLLPNIPSSARGL